MTREEALQSLQFLRPKAEWTWTFDKGVDADYAKLVWLDSVQVRPTLQELQLGVTQSQQDKTSKDTVLGQAKIILKDRSAKLEDRLEALIQILAL